MQTDVTWKLINKVCRVSLDSIFKECKGVKKNTDNKIDKRIYIKRV